MLAIDVGNTRVKIGLFAGNDCRGSYAIPVDACGDLGPVRRWIWEAGADVDQPAAVSDVNPLVTRDLVRAWRDEFGVTPRPVGRPRRWLLDVDVEKPDRVGPDRLFNAVAAKAIRPAGVTTLIVDAGTAITVDVVDAAGAFRGGAILPGFGLSAKALNAYTALLPAVPSADVASDTPTAIGRDTTAAIRSGLFWGAVGAVNELIARQRSELGVSDVDSEIVVTGGAGPRLVPYVAGARAEPYLALTGLVLTAADEAEHGEAADL